MDRTDDRPVLAVGNDVRSLPLAGDLNEGDPVEYREYQVAVSEDVAEELDLGEEWLDWQTVGLALSSDGTSITTTGIVTDPVRRAQNRKGAGKGMMVRCLSAMTVEEASLMLFALPFSLAALVILSLFYYPVLTETLFVLFMAVFVGGSCYSFWRVYNLNQRIRTSLEPDQD